jgi:hypothetical protein
MHTFISFLIIAGSILLYLIFYHKIDIVHIFEIMHSAFSRQFIFEIIPFIILFSVREIKFIDISSASEFFNSVIGRSLIGAFAFTFVTFSLNSVNPKFSDIIIDQAQSIKLNSFTPNVNNPEPVKEVEPIKEVEPVKEYINPYEKYITYATLQ